VNRREFLLLSPGRRKETAEISCERLYMHYLDAEVEGTTRDLFDALDEQLRSMRELRLLDTEWLSRADLLARVEPILAAFHARGGRVHR